MSVTKKQKRSSRAWVQNRRLKVWSATYAQNIRDHEHIHKFKQSMLRVIASMILPKATTRSKIKEGIKNLATPRRSMGGG